MTTSAGRIPRTRRTAIAVAGAVIALVAAACGGSSTADEGGMAGGDSPALADVYDAVDGLEGEERTAVLLDLAENEGGLTVYSSMNLDDVEPLLDAFDDKYGIEPNYYRASSSDVLLRILQETDAGFAGNDIVMANGPELVALDRAGHLAPLVSPTTADIIEAGVFDTWASVYMNTFVAAWNTNGVSDPPTTWEELLTDFDGQLVFELGDWDWFATITNRYFIAELGMTEDAVVELMKAAAKDAKVIDGHTLMAELLVAGEFDAATSVYHHRVAELMSEGAPIAWEPPLRPLIARPNGVAIMHHVSSPATALLWAEFLLTDAQQMLADDYRGPASTAVNGGISTEYDPILVDMEAITNEREKWESLWEEIVMQAG